MARKYIRMNSRRKARVEKILEGLGLTPSQAVNLFFAQIERRKAIPFALALDDRADILPPIEQVAKVWDGLDGEDFSHLDPRRAGLTTNNVLGSASLPYCTSPSRS